jgi:magnesium transporter
MYNEIVQNIDKPNELNVSRAHIGYEVKRRTPGALFAMLAGIIMLLIGRTFESALASKFELIFFIPVIVYMSDSIGTETLALFVRELALRRLHFKKIFFREALVGISLGLITGIPIGIFSYFWLRDLKLSLVIVLTMTVNSLVTMLVGMIVPILFVKFKRDPALETEEIATAISDIASMSIYFLVATLLLFRS